MRTTEYNQVNNPKVNIIAVSYSDEDNKRKELYIHDANAKNLMSNQTETFYKYPSSGYTNGLIKTELQSSPQPCLLQILPQQHQQAFILPTQKVPYEQLSHAPQQFIPSEHPLEIPQSIYPQVQIPMGIQVNMQNDTRNGYSNFLSETSEEDLCVRADAFCINSTSVVSKDANDLDENSFGSIPKSAQISEVVEYNVNSDTCLTEDPTVYSDKIEFPKVIPNPTSINFTSDNCSSIMDATGSRKTGKELKILSSRHRTNESHRRTRRSRMGCLTCRSRKKRCCERRPTCTECERLGMKCNWPVAGMEYRNRSKNNSMEGKGLIDSPFGKIKVLRGIVSKK